MRKRIDVHDARVCVSSCINVIWNDIHVHVHIVHIVHKDVSVDDASHIDKVLWNFHNFYVRHRVRSIKTLTEAYNFIINDKIYCMDRHYWRSGKGSVLVGRRSW